MRAMVTINIAILIGFMANEGIRDAVRNIRSIGDAFGL